MKLITRLGVTQALTDFYPKNNFQFRNIYLRIPIHLLYNLKC